MISNPFAFYFYLLSPFPHLQQVITFLSSSSEAEFLFNRPTPVEGCAVEVINETCQVYMLIKGLINIEDEVKKLEQKREKTNGDVEKLIKQTQNPNYHKVPEKTKTENETKLQTLKQELGVIESTIDNYKKFL